MKLFAIYIGGIHEKALIELHDMRFVIAENIEATYDSLKAYWWGTPESLHLDDWGSLEYADGHKIKLTPEAPQASENKLYFVNLGGYDGNEFTELHKNVFVVAPNASKAKVRALRQILDWKDHHRDYQYEVENILDLGKIAAEKNLYLHLEPTEIEEKFIFTNKFVPIGRTA